MTANIKSPKTLSNFDKYWETLAIVTGTEPSCFFFPCQVVLKISEMFDGYLKSPFEEKYIVIYIVDLVFATVYLSSASPQVWAVRDLENKTWKVFFLKSNIHYLLILAILR